ncbi:MAG: dihydroxy-acid dehydratase [bacterium]
MEQDKNNVVSTSHQQLMDLVRASLARSMGFKREDLRKPFIAVLHSWNEVSPGQYHLREVAQEIKASVKAAGGTPAEIIVPGVCGSMSGGGSEAFKYNVAYRDFGAAVVETMLRLNRCDGAILVGTCDHVIPALLIGAAWANIPTIILTGGYMPPGTYDNRPFTMFDIPKQYGRLKSGEITEGDLQEMVACACPGPGACPELGTAHTMATIAESLGMSLPGNTATMATSDFIIELGRLAGRKIMELVAKDIKPTDIMTRDAFENAMRVVLACGASPNALVHLSALMRAVDIYDLGWDRWDELSRITPLICKILPNHPHYNMSDLERAGKIKGVMKEMLPLLHGHCLTVTGESIAANLEAAEGSLDHNVVRPLTAPFAPDGGLVILKGSLAPEGAIVKKSAVPANMWRFTGRAKVFDSEEAAMDWLLVSDVPPNTMLVVRNEGPRGCPGGRKVYLPLHVIVGRGLIESVGLLTDGAFSGGNLGLGIGYVSPEAAAGGPLAVVVDGDEIEVDIENRRLELCISNAELEHRLQNWRPPVRKNHKGVLGLFNERAESYPKGAYVF